MTSTISARQTDEHHIIQWTEIFRDGRVMTFHFVRVATDYTATMLLYSDGKMQNGKRIFYISTMQESEQE